MITITEKAAVKVKEIAEAESLEGQGLRLRVVGGGCAGFSYDLYFEDKVGEMDEQFESQRREALRRPDELPVPRGHRDRLRRGAARRRLQVQQPELQGLLRLRLVVLGLTARLRSEPA